MIAGYNLTFLCSAASIISLQLPLKLTTHSKTGSLVTPSYKVFFFKISHTKMVEMGIKYGIATSACMKVNIHRGHTLHTSQICKLKKEGAYKICRRTPIRHESFISFKTNLFSNIVTILLNCRKAHSLKCYLLF